MLAVTKPGGTAASVFRIPPLTSPEDWYGTKSGYDGYAWFAGFAPYENPQIAVAVVIFQGGSGNYSSPVAKAIIEEFLKVKSSGPVMEPGNVLAR